MKIEVREVKSRRDLKTFIYLPEKIHKDHNNWLYPLYNDEWIFFDKNKNKAFSYSDTTLLLAYKDNKPVGRIMGIINKRYNELNNERFARFAYLECWDDQEVFNTLVEAIETWAKEKGMVKVVGPMAFSDEDPQGFLVQGFDEPTVMITNHSYPFMIDYTEAKGYSQRLDFVQYRVNIPEATPKLYELIAERSVRNGYKLIEFTKRKELKAWVKPILRLTNETYTKIFGYVPFDEEEMDDFAKRYLPIMNPHFIKVITNYDDEILAYVIGMPSASEGIKKAKGKLFPFGFLKVLREMKKTHQLDMLLGAVKPEYRGKGLDSLMAKAMLSSAREFDLTIMDSHLVMERNEPMRAEYERLNGEIYKKYRIFEKDI